MAADSGGGRVVAVLGYSRGDGSSLHPVCAERLAHAEGLAGGASAVLFSGWARRPHAVAEAELMRAGWGGPEVPLVCDPDARTTAGNAVNVVRAARALDADELVVVTSSWHRRRAHRLVDAAAGGSGLRVSVEASPGRRRPLLVVRELACFALLGVQLRRARARAAA